MTTPAHSRPPVVLLHAFPLDHRMWSAQVADLTADGWSVEAWDLPGFGGTSVPSAQPDLATVARGIADRVRERGLDPVVVAGVSLGGYVAMALLREAPDVLAGLMLCDTKAGADMPEACAQRLAMAQALEEDPDSWPAQIVDTLLPRLVGATTVASRPVVANRIRQWCTEASTGTLAWYQRAMAARPDSLDDLRAARLPTLVLWGEEDVLSPEADQRAMLACLPTALAAVIPQAGHLAVVEQPQAARVAMSAFLDGAFR